MQILSILNSLRLITS